MYELEFLFYGKTCYFPESDKASMKAFIDQELRSSDGKFAGAIPISLTEEGKTVFYRGKMTEQEQLFAAIDRILVEAVVE